MQKWPTYDAVKRGEVAAYALQELQPLKAAAAKYHYVQHDDTNVYAALENLLLQFKKQADEALESERMSRLHCSLGIS